MAEMNRPETKIPHHIGLIMDGNRRWAKVRGKRAIEGHREGYKVLKKIGDYALNQGVQELSAYVWSTENWNRIRQEVDWIMNFLRWIPKNEIKEMHNKNIRLKVPGLKDRVPKDILDLIKKAEAKTRDNTGGTLNLLFNYGGRPDIIEATKKLISSGIAADKVTEEDFSQALSTAGMSDVDLIIRTSECRLSNFLPWESVYAEICFMPQLLWPDFTPKHLDEALAFYAKTEQRIGA
jgi:undecaprenyl diphosphate synthase